MVEQTSLQCSEHLQTDQTVVLGQQPVQKQDVQGQRTVEGEACEIYVSGTISMQYIRIKARDLWN